MRALLLVSLALAACASGGQLPPPEDVVSVQYDPYRFEMAKLEQAALAQCGAKGFSRAVVLDNQPNTESVRWSYLTFGCYRR
jgi:hypothetical protein